MGEPSQRWTLESFLERLDTWVEVEKPSTDLRYVVTEWILSRFDDPYQGVRREYGFDNLWFGKIPHSQHGNDLIVVCSYWIEEQRHVVRCDSIASLSLPI